MTRPKLNVLIAPDSFKESLSAPDAARAMASGWMRGCPESQCRSIPLADGGEGTAAVLTEAAGGELVFVDVTGPLGAPVRAAYGLIDHGNTAVVELAAASGLALLPPALRDPLRTTTFGTGTLLGHALRRGCRHIILALGGSATNDGGAGIAQALGIRLLDRHGRDLPPGGQALEALASVDTSAAIPEIAQTCFTIACDVVNPLCGANGATFIYGPQKGAQSYQLSKLDAALFHYGNMLESLSGQQLLTVPGSGAAGGAAMPLLAFANARLRRGFTVVSEALGLEQQMRHADVVLTGEGAIDGQSAEGKVISGIVALASRYDTPVFAFAGARCDGYERLFEAGLTAAFSIAPGPCTVEKLVEEAMESLEKEVFNVAKCFGRARLGH